MSGENANSTGTAELKSLDCLTEAEQAAIRWRSELKSFRKIAELLQAEYGLVREERTIGSWFAPNGKLYQGYAEWRQLVAEAQAHDVADRMKISADASLQRLMQIITNPDDNIAIKAIKVHLDKVIASPKTMVELEITGTNEPPVTGYLEASIAKWSKIVEAGKSAVEKENQDA